VLVLEWVLERTGWVYYMACAPSWWRLHAFEWKGKTYVDTRLPFGSKGAVACFQRFSDALGRYVARQLPLAP